MSITLFIAGTLFIFIICIMGTLCSYSERRWKWFGLMLACTLISGAGLFTELYQCLMLPASPDLPVIIRQPTSPL
jgi:MFS-type transporter involved in bile tolerance (Atg22 family)